MNVHDLRSYLDVVRKAGELHEIRRTVDPVRELGAVLKACERADKAAFFHVVKGFDVPVVGGLLSSPRRIALALGCDVPEVGARMAAATEKPIAARVVDGPAPCQEIVIDKPDLGRWPIPTHSPLDAGAFITAGVVIARDPQTRRHNLSYNRMQIFGADRAGISMNIWRHIKAFFDKIEPQGRNLPFCVAIGPDPVVMMAAAFRYDGDEYEIAGALRGAPIPVVRALTCDVLVPASVRDRAGGRGPRRRAGNGRPDGRVHRALLGRGSQARRAHYTHHAPRKPDLPDDERRRLRARERREHDHARAAARALRAPHHPAAQGRAPAALRRRLHGDHQPRAAGARRGAATLRSPRWRRTSTSRR